MNNRNLLHSMVAGSEQSLGVQAFLLHSFSFHGVWFDFKGDFGRGEGKNPGDEAYYLVKGTLTRYSTDANKKTLSTPIDAVFKSFPESMDVPAKKQD